MSNPLVSVCLITYNHAKYIREAIDSVLMQEVDFPWELIIADDCSTDGTREIVSEYKGKYPEFIKLMLQEENVGAAINFGDLMTAASSKYIAYLEGDDYWNSTDKLQKQVDVLERNPHVAGCFSNAIIVDDTGRVVSDDYFAYYNMHVKIEIRTEDIVPFGMSPSNTLFFRREILMNPPDWFVRNNRHSGIDLLITLRGSLYCINEKLGAYRIHAGGGWSSTPLSFRLMIDLLFLKPMYRDKYMHDRYGPVIREAIRQRIVRLLECTMQDEGPGSVAANLAKFMFAYPRRIPFFILTPFWVLRYYEIKLRCAAIIGIKKVTSGGR